ncbi:MAG: hypothetical protein EP346_11330, partial [Bacteroidetes bacterium]
MNGKREQLLIYGGGILVILLNAIAIVTENFALMAIPFGLIVVAAALLQLDILMLFVIFATPLSVTLTDKNFNVGLSLPTEPILAGITGLLLFRFIQSGKVDLKVLRHPIAITIGLSLIWMGITTILSERPDVSIKYLIARIWFIVPYFYLMSQIFKDERKINWFYWLF